MNERKLRIDSFNSFIQFISTQMRHISVLTAIIFHFICICAYAQSENHITESENDVKTTTLQELVVTSDYAWVDGEKFVFVPRKNEKNLATDAISLIENMHIPVLYVDKGNIKSRTGGSVSIFINGVPADDMDMSTFWPKNALRVEFMESSPDPKFEGKHNILNFIMKDYALGGLTKLRGRQVIPNEGSYEASSKFVYKKMTYNAMFKGGYSRDHRSGSYGTETFKDIWYDGNFYDRIDRIENSDNNANRNDNIYAGINARYLTEKMNISHQAKLQWNRNPGSHKNGTLHFVPQIISGDNMLSQFNDRNISAFADGKYNFRFNAKWHFGVVWNFNHSHNNGFASYTSGDTEEIINRFRENSYSFGVEAGASYIMSQRIAFVLRVKEKRDIYSSYYTGSTDSHQWQSLGETFASLQWWYMPSSRVRMSITPQITIKDRNTNHLFKETQVLPGVQLNASYNINNKNNLSLWAFYHESTPAANATNDVIIRQTELTWLKGNPHIKSSDYYSLHLDYFTSPSSFLDLMLFSSWSLRRNEKMMRYFPGGKDYDGIILQYANAGHNGYFKAQCDINVRLFKNRLVLHGDIAYDYSYYTGGLHKSLAYFRPRVSASWSFGNCNLTAGWNGQQKGLSNGGTEETFYPNHCWMSFRYGNGSLNAGISVSQPFNNHTVQKSTTNDGPYSASRIQWSTGRSISIDLTYTFDYGKKIDPGFDIYEESLNNSSHL
ncbi:outer membrane beta-barrel protein [Bacteroides acidifaciens]|uniref:outer membrane beta-barrel protein n=1 Tax=Bacteroides acidifaciens TaxID=85831 RepID=UPI0025942C45|nr:outer membrane beta-barrel protein [Bacteroides acidifaciens]